MRVHYDQHGNNCLASYPIENVINVEFLKNGDVIVHTSGFPFEEKIAEYGGPDTSGWIVRDMRGRFVDVASWRISEGL